MKILLCGHACGPGLGSEPGVTWNWAWHLSQVHQVWAIVHPEHRREIELYLREHPNPNLNFVWVSLPCWIDPWKPETGERGIRLHYVMWQRAALSTARQLHPRIGFEVCQFVSWATILSSPLLWKLPVPFFWGPVGGGQTAPLALRKYWGASWGKEAARKIQLHVRRFMPSFRAAVRHSALILSSNSETSNVLAAVGARRIHLFPADSGVPPDVVIGRDRYSRDRKEIVVHWSGRVAPHKGLPLALEAFAIACRNVTLQLRLDISGDGPARAGCEILARALGVAAQVRFLGRIPRAQVLAHLQQADAFLFTSLRDSMGSVCLEAMAAGLPIILLDHQGVRHFVPPEASWRVPPTTAADTVERLAASIGRMAEDREDRLRRGQAACDFARAQTWPQRVELMTSLYERYCRQPSV